MLFELQQICLPLAVLAMEAPLALTATAAAPRTAWAAAALGPQKVAANLDHRAR